MTGSGAKAFSDRLLTMAPRAWVSTGRNAWITRYGPNRFTSSCRSSAARSLRSSYSAMPALLTRMSSAPMSRAAAWTCAASVTSRATGVTRGSGWVSGPRVPAYTRRAPRARASVTRACPMPRLAPVIRMVCSAMFTMVAPFGVISKYTDIDQPPPPESPRRKTQKTQATQKTSVPPGRRRHVVVHPHRGQPPVRPALVDRESRLRRQVVPAPADAVVFHRAARAFLGHRALLPDDPAPGAEALGEVGAQLAGPAVGVLRPDRLPGGPLPPPRPAPPRGAAR